MSFSKLIKNINCDNYKEADVRLDLIKAQYNPDRFKFWKSLHVGPKKEVLNMLYSPHFKLLKGYNDPYIKMQILYGKNDKLINDKVNKLISLCCDILACGLKESIIVLNKPLVENKYNDSFEIFEGHHRLACCLFLNYDVIKCHIVEV